ncbi:MAG: hypothetical protein V1934_09075 [Methanobacteriota archaeon]
MFGKAVVRAGWKFAIFFGVAIAVLSILAVLFSGGYESTWVSFKDKLFLGGLFVVTVGAFIGAGFAHNIYYGSGLYKMSSTYMHAVNDDRLQRRREDFVFMISCFIGGGALVLLPFLLP